MAKYDYDDSGNDVTGADVAGARPSIPDRSWSPGVWLMQTDTRGDTFRCPSLSTLGPAGLI